VVQGFDSLEFYSNKDLDRAVERFSIAQVNKELCSFKMKERASEKLHKRLSERRKLIRRGSRRMSDSSDVPMDASIDEVFFNSENKSIQAKKAELIREHKMQEARVKEILQHSQKRSSEALKKRLEEVQKNRIINMTISDDEMTSEEDEVMGGERGWLL